MGAKPLRPEERPTRPTKVGGFWINRTDVTNADFAQLAKATGHVILGKGPLDPKAYPGLGPQQLRPAAIVSVGADPPAGSDPSQWRRVIPGAHWRRPKGPGSSIAGQDNLPVVQIGWADAVAYAHWLGRDLPTEAECEYAAQGEGGPTLFIWGDRPLDPNHPRGQCMAGRIPQPGLRCGRLERVRPHPWLFPGQRLWPLWHGGQCLELDQGLVLPKPGFRRSGQSIEARRRRGRRSGRAAPRDQRRIVSVFAQLPLPPRRPGGRNHRHGRQPHRLSDDVGQCCESRPWRLRGRRTTSLG